MENSVEAKTDRMDEDPADRGKRINLIVGVSGASGSLYAARFIAALSRIPGRSSIIVSQPALRVYSKEIEPVETPEAFMESAFNLSSDFPHILPTSKSKASGLSSLSHTLHEFTVEDAADFGAKPASGSTHFDGMVIIPCSMKTLASISNGFAGNLMERAADVTLKERRRLILVTRESPYSLVHLKNMTSLTEAGGIILPASPGFYNHPSKVMDLVDFIVYRTLGMFDVPLPENMVYKNTEEL